MPLKTYTLEQVWELSEKCVEANDKKALGDIASIVAEDGNLYGAVELERIERKIESEHAKLN